MSSQSNNIAPHDHSRQRGVVLAGVPDVHGGVARRADLVGGVGEQREDDAFSWLDGAGVNRFDGERY